MTKHIVIRERTPKEFESALDTTAKEYNVFASQTHVMPDGTFVAVCFAREEPAKPKLKLGK